MKRMYSVLVLLCLIAVSAQAATWSGSGTYTVGTGGDYATMGDFFFAMTGFKQLTGTATVSAADTLVTGTATLFLSEVQVGDTLIISNSGGTDFGGVTVAAKYSDTSIQLSGNGSFATSGRSREIYRAPASAVTGNVIVEIVSDITEPNDIPLLVDLQTHTLTIKPAAGKTPTVTFTRAEDHNGGNGLSGHFMIGVGTCGYVEILNTVDDVIIDGSNSGGTSRDMTWLTATSMGYDGFVHVAGKNDGIVVKNMNFINNSTSSGSNPFYIRFTTKAQTALAAAGKPAVGWPGVAIYPPVNWKILNNVMKRSTSAATVAAQAIINTNHGTMAGGTYQSGFEIKDNYIEARMRGVFLNQGANPSTIERNTIVVNQLGLATGYVTHGIFVNNACSPVGPCTANFNYNFIDSAHPSYGAAAGQGPHGFSLYGLGSAANVVYNVIGNEVIVRMNRTLANTTYLQSVMGMDMNSAVTFNAWHNSISIPEIPNVSGQTSAGGYGIGGFLNVAYYADIKNNIIRVGEPGHVCIARANLGTGTFASDYNDLYAAAGAFIGREGATDYDLNGWRALGAGHDNNSEFLDPLTVWISSTALHFAQAPSWAWRSPALVGGPTVDIDGETRASVPYKGSDEAGLADASLTPPSKDFGPILQGTTKDAAVVVTKTGGTTATLVLYQPGVTMSGANPTKFYGNPFVPALVKLTSIGTTAGITITYAPGSGQGASYSATGTAIVNDPTPPTITLNGQTYTDVAGLTAARDALSSGAVRIHSECFVVSKTDGLDASGRHQLFIEDITGADGRTGIMVDDPSYVLARTYAIGDRFATDTVKGDVSTLGNMLTLVPTETWGDPTAGTPLGPLWLTGSVTDFETIEAELIGIQNADVAEAGNWTANTNYNLTAPGGLVVTAIRIEDNCERVGDSIPPGLMQIIGIAYDGSKLIEPRLDADIGAPNTRVTDWSMFR
jgi:hypothetical protein